MRKLKGKPSDNDLLELYALFKQATVGENNTSKWSSFEEGSGNFQYTFMNLGLPTWRTPRILQHCSGVPIYQFHFSFWSISKYIDIESFFIFILARPGMLDLKGKAKWDAWSKKQGMSTEEAKEKYVAKVQSLIESIGLQ